MQAARWAGPRCWRWCARAARSATPSVSSGTSSRFRAGKRWKRHSPPRRTPMRCASIWVTPDGRSRNWSTNWTWAPGTFSRAAPRRCSIPTRNRCGSGSSAKLSCGSPPAERPGSSGCVRPAGACRHAIDGLRLGQGGLAVLQRSASDPLVNTLVLTLKNTSNQVIRTVKPASGTPPQVKVSFVYGTSAGALAPIPQGSGPPPGDSAFQIRAATAVGEADWGATSLPVSDHGQPTWILTPADDNTQLFGAATGDTANYSVEFSQIRSFNEPGPTQMIVLCTGFTKDATTRYDDLVLVLDLDKADPPATRGLLAFGAPDAAVLVASRPGESLPVKFRWTMYAGVAKVRFLSSSPLVPSWCVPYPNRAGLRSEE